MFDEMDKNNTVSPIKFINDDNKVDSNQVVLLIEGKKDEDELILDGIKFNEI